MPQYDVHLYKLYRVKHAGVEASSMEEAITKAMELDDDEAECIENAEEPAYEALVDIVGDEQYDKTKRFQIMAGKPMTDNQGSSLSARDRALALCVELANRTIDGDFVNGEEYYADGNDEEISALYEAVGTAREILGLPDVAGEES